MGLIFDTIAIDNFTVLGAIPNPPWTQDALVDPMNVIAGGIAECTSVNEAMGIYSGPEAAGKFFNNNQFAQCVVQKCLTVNSSVLLILRRTDSSHGYFIEIDGPLGAGASYSVGKANGSVSNLFTTTTTVNPGDIIRLEVFGTTITAYLNGKVLFSGNDSDLTSGDVAIDLFPDTAVTDAQVKAFQAGDILQAGTQTGIPSFNPIPIPDIRFQGNGDDAFFAQADGPFATNRWASVAGFDVLKYFGGSATLETAGANGAEFWTTPLEANHFAEVQLSVFESGTSGSIWIRATDDLVTAYEFRFTSLAADQTTAPFHVQLIVHGPSGDTEVIYDIPLLILSDDDFVRAFAYGGLLGMQRSGSLLFSVLDDTISEGGVAISINGNGSEAGDSGAFFNFVTGNLSQ
jgi:hypothetical protein